MGLLDKIKDVFKEPTKDDLKEIEFDGLYSTAYFQDSIEKVISKIMPINNRYIMETLDNNMVVWKYNPCIVKHVKFEKDPKNEHDSNAIKIMAGSSLIDMNLIGYIPKDKNKSFAKLMDQGKIYNINLTITGGPRKVIAANDTACFDEQYKVNLKVIVKK